MAKGSNHSFGKPKQTKTVKPMKDHRAMNVGGMSHMSAGDTAKPFKGEKFTGGGNGSGRGKHKS